MDQNENLIRPFIILWQHKNKILLFCFVAALLAVVVSLIKPNYYQSTSLFYPASTDLAKPLPIGNLETKMDYYGESEDLDRLFTIAKSRELKDFLINKFDLYTHYEIDSTGTKASYKMDLKLKKLFEATKTKYDALELSVEDKDPAFAQSVVNAATDKINELAQGVIKQSQKTLLENYNLTLKTKTEELGQLAKKINSLRSKYGIYSLEDQAASLSELLPQVKSKYFLTKAKYESLKSTGGNPDTINLVKAQLSGLEAQKKALEGSASKFNEGYLEVLALEEEQEAYTKQMGLDRQRASQLEAAYKTPFSAIHLIEYGDLPKIKSRPVRSLIVIGTVFVAFICVCLYFLIRDLINRLPDSFWKV